MAADAGTDFVQKKNTDISLVNSTIKQKHILIKKW